MLQNTLPSPDYRLPCDVRPPGGMTIGRGCELSTLLLALRRSEDGEPWQRSLDEPIPVDPRLQEALTELRPCPRLATGTTRVSSGRKGDIFNYRTDRPLLAQAV